MMERTSTMTQ
jgi:hypothetical protein